MQRHAAPSELRQDLLTGDWVVIATGRAKRPEQYIQAHDRASSQLQSRDDPFENPDASGQEKDVLIYRDPSGSWSTRVFPNKYPALSPADAPIERAEGPYFALSGTGYHEVVVTRDAERHFAFLDVPHVMEVIDAYQERTLAIMRDHRIRYVGIIHNHGATAGASIAHPHSQIFALPVVPPGIRAELDGAERYWRFHHRNVFDAIASYEWESSKRIVYGNEHFFAFCPFASRIAFEVWIMPRRQNPYFERTTVNEKAALAEVLRAVMASLERTLGDPPYNMYIHTAPCDGRDYSSYRWFMTILPRTATWAGFELSTGVEICTLPPETAAEHLRAHIVV